MISHWPRHLSLGLLALLLVGCPEPPTAEMDLAEQALEAARQAQAADCATAAYRSAEAMLEKARAQLAAEDYEEAKATAQAAEALAQKAKREAEASGDCKKTPADTAAETAPEVTTESSAPTDASRQASPFDDPNYELARIHFPYNEYGIGEEAARVLADNAEWMRRHPEASVLIEGHCDARGSVEYNLALGERRAQAVRKYLTDLGIPQDRLSILTYGEEQPLDPGANEVAWARNRRAEFRKR